MGVKIPYEWQIKLVGANLRFESGWMFKSIVDQDRQSAANKGPNKIDYRIIELLITKLRWFKPIVQSQD